MELSISVVIPCYRAEHSIKRTLDSVVNAGVNLKNIIVVEDGVFDNTEKIITYFPGVNHIQQKLNKGAPTARNIGLKNTKTEFVMFLDSDDFISQDHLINLYKSGISEKADIIFGPWRLAGEKMGEGPINYPPRISSEEWLLRWLTDDFVPTCSVLWSTDFVRKIGGWNTNLRQNDDGEIAIRGLMNTTKLAFSKKGFSTYWQHNSPYRISKSSEAHRLHSANIIYKQVKPWVKKFNNDKYNSSLGAFCIKQYWSAIASNAGKEEKTKWKKRALKLGYKKSGYNSKTNLWSALIGVRLSIFLRNYIHRPLLYMKRQ